MINIFNRKPKTQRSLYIAGYDFDEDIEGILYSQHIKEGDLTRENQELNYLRLDIDSKDRVIKTFDLETKEFSDTERPVISDFKLPSNKHIYLIEDSEGEHVFGGDTPKGLNIPDQKSLKTGIDYVGTLSTNIPEFEWIGTDNLHLVHAFKECQNDIAYYDCSNVLNPELINPEVFSDHWFDSDNQRKPIRKKSRKYTIGRIDGLEDFEKSIHKESSIIRAGIPAWSQFPRIPRDPKTGDIMKFVIQVNSNTVFEKYNNFEDVYFFFNPKTRTLGVVMQIS